MTCELQVIGLDRGIAMPLYVIAYHHGKDFARPKDGAKHMANWRAWMAGLGEAVVERGKPVGRSKMVGKGGVTDGGSLAGYTLVNAANMDAAVKMAQACPHLDIGSIEVAEAMDMEM